MRSSATRLPSVVSTCAGRLRRRSAAALELALDSALRLALGDVAALVANFLPPGERELDLGAAVLEVEPRGDERQALLGDLRGELVDLAAVEEKPAVSVGVVRLDRGLLVGRDVRADEPELAAPGIGVGALQHRVALPQRLHLAAGELETGLDALEQVVLAPRTAVLRDQLLA